MMCLSNDSHSCTALKQWRIYIGKVNARGAETAIDGHSLDIATVVAIARHGALAYLDPTLDVNVESARLVQSGIETGQVIYGVNTGFGGSADTRPTGIEELQNTLIRELHSGILNSPSDHDETSINQHGPLPSASDTSFLPQLRPLPIEDGEAATVMPESWAKASILIRINSLASGRSGVRPILIQSMVDLLRRDVVPRIPLRGSISASGDLIPLSYLGGLLQGKPTITAWAGDRTTGQRRVVRADVALTESSLDPIRLGPKEGLAIINGTAVSTAVAALVVHEANNIAILSQVLAAMSVDALCGTRESFHPFFAMVRPHPGQLDVSRNIYSFLHGSKLTELNHGLEKGSLRQDRYSIRTASQWLGPAVEDLLLAYRQVTIECNSVTDNPLVDIESARMLHGGNFQAKSITSAMEKTRLAMQTIGQMLFAQCTELINPKFNYGLPPNLVADNPSTSFLMKSMDIMVAALQSELGFLATPAGTHVLSAEMGNQSLNSLALISARYTLLAVDVLSQLASAHLFALCQAMDLRAMHIRFLEAFEPRFRAITIELLASIFSTKQDMEVLHAQLWLRMRNSMDQTTSLDPPERFLTVFQSLQPLVIDLAINTADTIAALRNWTKRCSDSALETFELTRDSYVMHPDATPFTSVASTRMYKYVRYDLSVPFVRGSQLEKQSSTTGLDRGGQHQSRNDSRARTSVGSLVSSIYKSAKVGALYSPVMECLAGVEHNEGKLRSSL